jgi:flagellar basal body-associated protein FliL
MSDTTQPAAAKPDRATAPAKGGPAVPITIGILVVALAAGVALGTLVLGPKLASSKHAAAAPAEANGGAEGKHGKQGKEGKEDKAAFYRVENIIVNPSGSEGAHFLMATVAIALNDSKSEEFLKAHEDELRDRVISVLEKQSLESLSAPGARDTLRGRIATALSPLIGKADPSRIFLPQFVIQ